MLDKKINDTIDILIIPPIWVKNMFKHIKTITVQVLSRRNIEGESYCDCESGRKPF